ncbi:MAG TPA: hypothetical protein VIW26_04440, partial [Gemmatimonadales bacterium]
MLKSTALWGKTAFRVNDSLKADTADIAVAVNHIAGTTKRWPGGTGARVRKRRRPMWQALLGFDLPLWAKFLFAFAVLLALFSGLFYVARRFGGGALGGTTGTRG